MSRLGGGVTDHGALSGLGDDDHSQYYGSGLREPGHGDLTGVGGEDHHTHAPYNRTASSTADEGTVSQETIDISSKPAFLIAARLHLSSPGNQSATTRLRVHWEGGGTTDFDVSGTSGVGQETTTFTPGDFFDGSNETNRVNKLELITIENSGTGHSHEWNMVVA